jgi:hypothetical protein
MAWLHHIPERQQYKQQLYECFDLNAMRDNELSQVCGRLCGMSLVVVVCVAV